VGVDPVLLHHVLEVALEAGRITEQHFYNGQAINGMFSAAQVALTATTAGMGSGWAAAGQGMAGVAGRSALVGAGLGMGNEAFNMAAEELMNFVGGLPSDLTACEVLERLKNAGLVGGALGGLGGGAAKGLSEVDWRQLLSRFRHSDEAIEALNAAKTTPTLKTVTSWADEGITPDLNPGRWVQLGEATTSNFWRTGLPGPKLTLNPLKLEGSKVPFSNSVTGQVPASSLQWPSGWEKWKGILGQRQITGGSQ
jgi:hypothetical protein